MKRIPHLLVAFMALASLFSCQKDDDITTPTPGTPGSTTPVAVKFGENVSIPENGGAVQITLQFSKPAFRDGSLEVEMMTDVPEAFQTVPAAVNDFIEISVSKGSSSAVFSLTPTDNIVLDEERSVTFELTDVSEGFSIGTKSEFVVTLVDDEAPVSVIFPESSLSLPENEQNGLTVSFELSAPAPAAGKVIVEIDEMPAESYFTTEPAFNANGQLTIEIPAGATAGGFKIIPTDNGMLKGDRKVVFSIADTEGAIVKGNQLSLELTVLDDELFFKAKSYETGGGGWSSKESYEYDEYGRVHKVHWENRTPGLRQGTYTYYYAENGLIERVNHYEGRDEYFYQENGRIVRSEEIHDGELKSYSLYDYDPAGNLGAQALYQRNIYTGELFNSKIFVYLYFNDGNIYKQLIYSPTEDPEEPELISTRTFDNYTNKLNPFPIRFIPGIAAQLHLPGSYRMEENGANLLYNFSYEFNENGLPVRRTTTGSLGAEVTVYQYY